MQNQCENLKRHRFVQGQVCAYFYHNDGYTSLEIHLFYQFLQNQSVKVHKGFYHSFDLNNQPEIRTRILVILQ